MSIKRLLTFSNGFYLLSAIALLVIVSYLGYNISNSIKETDISQKIVCNLNEILVSGLQKNVSLNSILIYPQNERARKNFNQAQDNMDKAIKEALSIAMKAKKKNY